MEDFACPTAAHGDDRQMCNHRPSIDDMWLEILSYNSKEADSSFTDNNFNPEHDIQSQQECFGQNLEPTTDGVIPSCSTFQHQPNEFEKAPPTFTSSLNLDVFSGMEFLQNPLLIDGLTQFSLAEGVSCASAGYQKPERLTEEKLNLSDPATGELPIFQSLSADNPDAKRKIFGASSEGSFDFEIQVPHKRYKKLKRESVAVLQEWGNSHLKDLYPAREVKQQLALSSRLSENQDSSWLINFRACQLSSHESGIWQKTIKQSSRNPSRNPNQLTPMQAWLSSSDDEAASPEDIERAAEYLEYSPRTHSQSSSYAGSMSASSAQSAFSQCSDAMRNGPPRRGRKKIIAPGPGADDTDMRKKRPHSQITGDEYSTGYPFLEFIDPSLLNTTSPPDIDDGSTKKRKCNIETANRNPFNNSSSNSSSNSLRVPIASGSKIAPIYQCTFCHKHLSSKTWKRHEETQHLPRTRWACMLDGFTTKSLDPPSSQSCVFCDSNLDHVAVEIHAMFCPSRIHECRKRDIQERTFDRKDVLKQHLKNFHRVTLGEAQILRWKVDVPRKEQQWPCGFCGLTLDDWDTRASHIAKHFRNGSDMSAWNSNRMSWS